MSWRRLLFLVSRATSRRRSGDEIDSADRPSGVAPRRAAERRGKPGAMRRIGRRLPKRLRPRDRLRSPQRPMVRADSGRRWCVSRETDRPMAAVDAPRSEERSVRVGHANRLEGVPGAFLRTNRLGRATRSRRVRSSVGVSGRSNARNPSPVHVTGRSCQFFAGTSYEGKRDSMTIRSESTSSGW